MSAQPFLDQCEYSKITKRPANYSQNLWKVNDVELYKPGERFIGDVSPYLETIIAQGVCGPLEGAPVPQGLLLFINNTIRTFGAVSTKYSSTVDVVRRVMTLIDFTEPYFLFVGSVVQLNSNQLKYTYRLKSNGSVLDPQVIECFNVCHSYEFDQFRAASELLTHDEVVAVLEGQKVKHPREERNITRDDVLDKLAGIIYGDAPTLRSVVEEWLFDHYSDVRRGTNLTDEDLLQLDSDQRMDSFFWTVATVGTLLWLKSRYALRFLAEYHLIYGALLDWNEKLEKVVVIPESGGEVIVDGWSIYTRRDVAVEVAKPPGTCECCKQSLHCTKFLNAQALFHPMCSCGQIVPVEQTDFQGHSWDKGCNPYLKTHPPFNAFVCQRCISMTLQQQDPAVAKCQRISCPATKCPHHAGNGTYIRELTKRRALMLTDRQVSM